VTANKRQRYIFRIEISSCVGCAALGSALYVVAGSTLRDVWLPLFGWAFGCCFHLIQVLISHYIASAYSHYRNTSLSRH
jgi:hypothetical protein